MTEEEARAETIRIFGEHSFTESCSDNGVDRYYVGKLPVSPGVYYGYMGLSWEEALQFAEGFK